MTLSDQVDVRPKDGLGNIDNEHFWLFGYGSLIWKAPAHEVEARPGYIKGYVRRFWQSSIDHRGVPERPGRVVTLLTREQFKQCCHEMPNDECNEAAEEPVWGMAYRIDPKYAKAVREELDIREINGYTVHRELVWGPHDPHKHMNGGGSVGAKMWILYARMQLCILGRRITRLLWDHLVR